MLIYVFNLPLPWSCCELGKKDLPNIFAVVLCGSLGVALTGMERSGDGVEPSPKYSLFPFVTRELVAEFVASLGSSFSELKISTLSESVVEIVSSRAVECSANKLPVPLSRIAVKRDGHFAFEVLYGGFSEYGQCVENLLELKPFLERMVHGPWKYCPGVLDYENRFESVIRFRPAKLRLWNLPFLRVDSRDCKVLFRLARSVPQETKLLDTVLCPECKRFEKELVTLKERAAGRTPEEKKKRVSVSSNTPLQFLSPNSRNVRITSSRVERRQLNRDLSKYEHLSVSLSDKQSSELSAACKVIDKDFQGELQSVTSGGEMIGGKMDEAREVVKAAWDADKVEWQQDQANNEQGAHGNRWSLLTYRVALAVFSRSRAAYEALRGFGIFKLPSIRSLQHYTSAYLDKPGRCETSIKFQKEVYDGVKKEASGKCFPPIGEGVMIFDEVKVISKILWNSRSHEVYGLAMTDDDMISLCDVFAELNGKKTERTEYVLQFIWRDMSSTFDVYGPYFTTHSSLDAKFTLACVLDTLRLLHDFGFKTCALICDGAATNLAVIKSMMGVRGAFGMKSESTPDRHAIDSSIPHPFWRHKKLFLIVCPAHQLKNMVNALHSSRQAGTKGFVTASSVCFGWQAIVDLYDREVARFTKGVPREVPKLRKNHVIRDAWTKLNVLPAKVVQQEEVLTELAEYLLVDHPDNLNVQATRDYLLACHKFFEKGVLSHERVRSVESAPIASIVKGFDFWTKWLDGLLAHKQGFEAKDPRQKDFLAWQTWDLLRVVRYGFVEFCKDFTARNPGYYVVPVRVTGSAIETVFSQLKHAAGGRLTATNFASARASLAIQRHSVPCHPANTGYRDAPVNFAPVPLLRRK